MDSINSNPSGTSQNLPDICWSLDRIGVRPLWDSGLTGAGVLIAMIDTGINYQHPDLQSQLWQGGPEYPCHGYNFIDQNNDTFDMLGHGTAVASQIVGNGHCGTRTGVAPGARLMCLKVDNDESQVWQAFEFALAQGAHVISMSKTFKSSPRASHQRWRTLCRRVLQQQVLHANSAGNQGNNLIYAPLPANIGAPANCPPPADEQGSTSVISCGVTNQHDVLMSASSKGPVDWSQPPFDDYPYCQGKGLIKPEICAPGSATIACNARYPERSDRPYNEFMGTSSAAAHLGGCLALLAQACLRSGHPISPVRVYRALTASAVSLKGQRQNPENGYGAGRVDLFAAYIYGVKQGWWY